MADYKDYIVRYDIQADVTKATQGLQAIADIAKQFEGPMKTLKEAIGTVNSSLLSLKSNSQLSFEPKIDVRAFNNQLRGMVVQVKNAAAEMHAALFEALQGNAPAGKAMRKGVGQALGLKSVSELKSDIAAYEKELDKLMGTRTTNKKGQTRRAADGSIQMAKNAGLMGRVTELEGRKSALQRALKQHRAELVEAEKLEKEMASQQAKAEKAATKAAGTSAVVPKTQPARMTNVTPAVIREWKKAFGDAKNKQLTVNIRGNATGPNGALTTIAQIQTALQELQAKSTFNINPTLNMEGFAAAEAQLMKLAELSKAVTAPFASTTKTAKGSGKGVLAALTKDEQTRLTQAQQNVKMWNEKIAGVQQRLEANKAKYAQAPTSALKGQITRDENKLTTYRGQLSEQENIVSQLQSKAAKAIPAAGKTARPLTIDVLGNLTGLKSNGKELVVPVVGELTKIQNKVKEAIPVNVKIMADQVAESLRSVPRPSILVDVRLNTEGIAQQIQAIGQSRPVTKAKQPVQPVTAPITSAWTANDETLLASQIAEKDRLKKLRDNARRRLTTAQARHEESGGSDRTWNRLLQAKKDFGTSQQQYTEAQEKVNTLMQRKTQSTAAPVMPTTTTAPTTPIGGKAVKAQPLAIDVMANVTGVKATTEMMIPVVGEMAKVINKSGVEVMVPAIGELSKVVNKISAEVFVPVIGELTKVVSKISTEIITPVVGEITKVVSKGTAEAVVPVVGEIARTVVKGTGEQVAPVIGELSKVVNKIGVETLVPVVGELTKVVSKISAETLVPVIGELSKVVSKVTTEVLVPIVGQLNKILNEAPSEITIPVVGKLTKVIAEAAEVTVPIIGKLNTAGITEQIKSLPRPTLPVNMKLMWERGAIGRQEQLKSLTQKLPPIVLTLETTAAVEKLNEFITLVRSKSPQNIALTATGTATKAGAATGAATTSAVVGAATKSKAVAGTSTSSGKTKEPPTAQERYEKMKANAARNVLTPKQNVSKWQEQQMKERNWYAQQQAKYDRLFGAVKSDEGWFNRAQTQRNAELAQMRADAQAAFGRGLTPYEKQLQAQQRIISASSIARHQRQAEGIRAKVWNSMAPFAQNKEQLGVMVKHRKFFRQAVRSTGITPTTTTAAPQMLQYLQGVSAQMQQASVAIPWQLQSQINKLQAQINKANGVPPTQATTRTTPTATRPARVSAPVPFYDKARKWAYPFTGNTSFGARTPMAVDMAKGMGVMFAIGGAMSAVGNSFSQAMEYQNTMRTTKAILQNGTKTYTDTGFRGMEEIVRNVGVKTKFSAPEVASAARFLAMAGYDIPAINNAIRPIADLALIGDTDLGETADKMTNIMTTFGIPAEKMREAANIMTTTSTRSNTDLMMLAESAKYGGGVANMYGRGDKNLFADTMALFGVMGNAGIQASSAGTALRMMYQNIFKPNKNQKAVLDMLDKNYGIKTLKKDGGFRAMSDIVVDIAQKVPQDQLASIVGNLFRITAQPGASASIMAASNQAIAKAAEEDGSNAEEVAAGGKAIEDFLEKNGLSKLVELMLANRESINGNVSETIALEKQNTVQGLLAQASSTFTEGIVKAFEGREDYFAKLLGDLRDYFAKPETIEMIQNLLDMLVSLGKTLAWFVKLWADLYNLFPNIIKGWIIIQAALTQIGTLITPFVSLVGVFTRLASAIMALSGASTTATASISAQTAATRTATGTNAVNMASIATGGKTWYGATKTATYNAAAPASMMVGAGIGRFAGKGHTSGYLKQASLYENAITGAMIAQGFTGSAATNAENRALVASRDNRVAVAMANKQRYLDRYTEVQSRAKRIYGTWGRSKRAFNAARLVDVASLTLMAGSIKNIFSGLMVGLAKCIGFLFNPITLALGAVAGFGFGLYKLAQWTNGATDEQIAARKKLNDEFAKAYDAEAERHKNVTEFLNRNGIKTAKMSDYQIDDTEAEERHNALVSSYSYLFDNEDIIKNTSRKSNQDIVKTLRERYAFDNSMRLALNAEEYEKLLGKGLVIQAEQREKAINPLSQNYAEQYLATAILNWWSGEEDSTKELLNKAAVLAVKNEGAKDERILKAREEIVELRKKYQDIEEFRAQAMAVVNRTVDPRDWNLLSDKYINADILGQEGFDWSTLQSYAWAGYNVLMAEIEGQRGSAVDAMLAIEELKGQLIPYSAEWYETISRILNNYNIIRNIVWDGKIYRDVNILLSTLPDGRLNFDDILQQIKAKVAGFKGSIKLFVEFAAQAYKMMIEAGAKLDSSKAGYAKYIREQLKGFGLTDEEINQYYVPTEKDKEKEKQKTGFYIEAPKVPEAPKPLSESVTNLWGQSSFNLWSGTDTSNTSVSKGQGPLLMDNNPADAWMPSWMKDRKKKEDNALDNLINSSVDKFYDPAKDPSNQTTTTTTTTKTNPTGGKTDPTKQEDYKSHYDRTSARPTQVIINVDKLANFDRTMIASSAEERDLIAAMENRITEAVYRVFAEAANSANNIMDRV